MDRDAHSDTKQVSGAQVIQSGDLFPTPREVIVIGPDYAIATTIRLVMYEEAHRSLLRQQVS